MSHVSLKLDTPCEFINITPINPLISKCQVKVCYVGNEPNRNRSIITKEVATSMANSIPGSPIVGFFNENKQDFEEHNRAIDISNGKLTFKDTTRPYGFVDLGAKVWFQRFLDDGVEHEYLMTEGYLWTGQYPECSRIITKGNNQSMELDNKFLDATWTKDDNGKPEFFIINEAIMSKLCILGEDVEPCFEGASISKIQFSFDDGFKEDFALMINQMKEILNEGGGAPMSKYIVVSNEEATEFANRIQEGFEYSLMNVYSDNEQKFAVLKKDDIFYRYDINADEEISIDNLTEIEYSLENFETIEESEFKCGGGADSASSSDKKKKKDFKADKKKEDEEEEDSEESEDNKPPFPPKKEDDSEGEDKEASDEEENKKKKKKYSLDEIPEYAELQTQYSALEQKYNDLVAENEVLVGEFNKLSEFKKTVDRQQKQDLINKFFMLSDADKKDVIENIDTYSLDDIEAKLSIICFRNKVSFADLEDDKSKQKDPMVYNLGSEEDDSAVPEWVKALRKTAKEMQD